MDFENRYDGIEDYAVQTIKCKARQLIGSAGFTESDLEDLEQELIIDLLLRLSKYNPDRAQRNTFITRVVDHRIATILEKRTAGKRDWRLCTASWSDWIKLEEGGSVERLEAYDLEEYLRQTGRLSRKSVDRLDLSIDLRRVIASLPPELRALCERLQSESVTGISRDTGIPRGTLYERIKKLHDLFEDAGLSDYL